MPEAAAAVPTPANETRAALIAGIACYGIWGLIPILYLLSSSLGIGAFEMTAHRALWAVLWAGGLVMLAGQAGQVGRVLRNRRTLGILAITSLLIGVNWLIFVWAISNGRTLEAGFAYYINPLLNVAAGAVLFRERIDRWGVLAVSLAAVGVTIQGIAIGQFPWISLSLALLFWTYGILRKRVAADAQTGLFVECLFLTLPGLAWVVWLESSGQGSLGGGPGVVAVLLANGPATVVPLALFAWTARRLPLSTVGFLQFIGPTLTFFVGIAAGERFTAWHAASFAFIWAAVAAFAWGLWMRARRPVLAPVQAPA